MLQSIHDKLKGWLAGVVLGVMAAGSTPEDFRWFEAPSSDRIGAARELLTRLGAIEGTRVTALGHQLRRLPLPPRLACVLIAAGGAWGAGVAGLACPARAPVAKRTAAPNASSEWSLILMI